MSLVHLPTAPITCKNLVGGRWVAPDVPSRDVVSPYTGTRIGTVPMSGAGEVDTVVREAARAAAGWRETPLRDRCARMFAFRELLLANLDRLAHSAAAEAGKTVAEARAGVLKGVEVVEYALSLQNLDTGGILEVSRGVTCEVRREPLGVVAGITPFNFPAMVPLWMIPNALTTGNAFVLKPSEKVPLTAQILGELLLEAGVPPGVFSIVNGGAAAVEAILDHPGIAAVAFVGSTPVARKVYERGTAHGKRALALGGAKNHLIVVPDADPEMTAQAVVDSFTGCAGQRCMAASILVAVGDVDPIVDRIVDRARAMRLGADMGAIIDRGSVERLENAVSKAQAEGAKVVLDGRGKRPDEATYREGNWFAPTIVDQVAPGSETAQRELFGPLLGIVRVKSLSEALAVENGSPYGNAASIFTQSGAVAEHVASHARAGMIGVNVGVPVPREPFSFGGMLESKFGHGDITGESSLDFWTTAKKVTRKWAPQKDSTWMG